MKVVLYLVCACVWLFSAVIGTMVASMSGGSTVHVIAAGLAWLCVFLNTAMAVVSAMPGGGDVGAG